MRRSVLWSDDALRDLDESIAYIAERNPSAVRKVLEEIRQAAHALGVAALGRRGRVADTYEKTVTRRRYFIAYAIDSQPDGGERVVILRVIHTARDWPPGQWPN